MNFPTPAETAVSTETETTETETETVFDGVNDEYETYWAVVDTYRFVSKLARTYLFTADERADGVTNADIAALKSESPIAEHFVFYKEQKDEMKDDFNDRRGDDIPTRASLPVYRKERGSPDFDHSEIREDDLEDYGIPADLWSDRDECVFLPADYEPVTDDDGNLVVWFEADNGEKDFTMTEVLKIAEDTKGIGKKSLANLEAALEAALE